MRFLRTNTAVIITVGPFYDKTDGVTIETALTITNERITLTADTDAGSAPTNILDNVTGATSGTANDLNYITGNDAGMMQLELAAADVNRVGRMFLSITDAANHVPVFHEFMVLPAMIYDAFVLGTDVLDASVTQWLGTAAATPTVAGVPEVDMTHLVGVAQSATDLKDFADDGYDPATNKVEGVKLADTVTTYTGNTVQTGDSFARLGAPAGASVSVDIAAIEAQTDDIGAAGAGLTAVPWNAAWDAEVQSEAEDALVVHRLDELLAADSDIDGAAPPTVGSVVHELMSKTAGSFTFDQTTDSLEAIRDKETDIETDTAEIGAAGAGLTNINLPNQTMDIVGNITGNLSGSVGSVTAGVTLAAAAVQAIWDALTSALTTASSIGKLLVDNINATISSRLATAGYTTPPTVGAIADQVWDEAIADHAGAGSTGAALSAAGSAGDPWGTALPGAYGAGTAGKIIGDNVNATVSSRASQTAVDDLPTNTELATALGTADDATLAAIATLQALVDDLEGRLTAARAGYLDNLSAGAVALASGVTVATNNDKTGYALSATGSAALTEGYAADGAAATLPQLLYMIQALLSEFSITGTALTAKKLDGSTTAGTFTLNDAASPTSITRVT